MKTVSFLLAVAAGCLVSAIGADDQPPAQLPKVSVVASDPVAFQGLTTGSFTLYRDGTNGDLAVKVMLSGSASNGVDYATLPDSVTIPAGFHAVGLVVQPSSTGGASPGKWVKLTIKTNDTYQAARPTHARVLIRGNAFENDAPSVAITSPADNSSVAAHSDLTVTADATDDDMVEKVNFYANDHLLGSVTTSPYSLVWSNVPPGHFALFARAVDQFGKSSLSAAVHVTATNPPPVSGAVTITTPTNGSSFTAGANIPITASVENEGATKNVNFYSGDHLLGTVSSAPFSLTWSNVPPGKYTLRAKATGTNDSTAVSDKVLISVTNPLPSVTITSPTNSSSYATPTDVTITADASDDNGIKSVSFFADYRLLGTDKAAPYSLTWSNVPPGHHILIAVAQDTFGAYKLSEAVKITVSNAPPTISITAPADGDSLQAPATIELKADASDTDGIRYVAFWSGKRLLGIDKTAPFSLSLNNVRAGSYNFTAEAIDKFGGRTISSPVSVTVKGTVGTH